MQELARRDPQTAMVNFMVNTAFCTSIQLYNCFKRLQINHESFEHPSVYTVEQSKKKTGFLPGAHNKNLFLRDKKRNLWLVSALDNQIIELKLLRPFLGASGSLSFGDAATLKKNLGVEPGSVTPFAIINDKRRAVKVVLDKNLLDFCTINAHPLRNNMTVAISSKDLLRFLKAYDHSPVVVDFAQLTCADSRPNC